MDACHRTMPIKQLFLLRVVGRRVKGFWAVGALALYQFSDTVGFFQWLVISGNSADACRHHFRDFGKDVAI